MSYGGGYHNSPDRMHESSDRSGYKTGEKEEKKSSIIPITIKMLKDAQAISENDEIKFDDQKADHLQIIGRLIDTKDLPSRQTLIIDDCTGILETVIYKKSETEIPKIIANIELKQGMYLKIVVLVRSFKGNFMSVCSYIQEVYDFNEVTLHMSKVVHSFLHRSKGYLRDEKSNQMRTEQASGGKAPAGNQISSVKIHEIEQSINKVLSAGQLNEQRVLEVIKLIAQKNSDSRVSFSQLEEGFKRRLTGLELKKHLRDLNSRGHLFETGSNMYEIL